MFKYVQIKCFVETITVVQEVVFSHYLSGTYVSQSAFTTAAKGKKNVDRPPLRGYLMSGNYFVGAALSTVLTKLALRFPLVNSKPTRQNVSSYV